MSCGRARTHDHRISSQRLTLSRHTVRPTHTYLVCLLSHSATCITHLQFSIDGLSAACTFMLGLSRLIYSNRFESIQVANRLIDSKLLNRFTEKIHYFYLFNSIVAKNANKLIFIWHNKQYYIITVTGWCIMMYFMFFVHCYFVYRFLFIVILFNKSFKWHSELEI